jgi:hypothetical protein
MNKMFCALALALCAFVGTAHASIVKWQLDGTLDAVRTLGNFGSPEVGSPFSATMTFDTSAPNTPLEPNQGLWFGLFQSFDFAIGAQRIA